MKKSDVLIIIPAYNEEQMVALAARTIGDVLTDAAIPHELLFVCDGSYPLTAEDEAIIDLCCEHENAVALINKTDLGNAVEPGDLPFMNVIYICAKTGDGVDALLAQCEKYAVEGPFLFDEELTTDQPERQVMAEIIREKLLWCLEKEIPHGTAVEITTFT